MKFYICSHCGNIIAYVKDQGVPVMWCGQKMEELVPNTTDAAVDAATATLVDILDGRPTTIDGVIAFLEGPAKEMLGEEAAAAGLAAQLKRKEEGAKWCDCDACTAATEILAKFGRVEL